MIQYALLVALGFFLASIIFILVAPSFWNRAVRLTRKRIEETLPVSLSEIEADKDQLRAAFAVKIRRLEAALTKTREKSAHQLVEISRLQMVITSLRDQIAALERSLDERRNAASVFELTIKRRFPELEAALAAAEALVEKRSYEVSELTSKMKRREELLVQTQRAAALQQAEITRLREAMEKSGAERSGRFKKRPSQWSLDEYRSEYDRLNVELSKLREQLSSAYDREANQISFLKAELQQLGEQILSSSVSASETPADETRAPAGDKSPVREPQRPFIYRSPARRPGVDSPRPQPRPWPTQEGEVEAEPLDRTEGVTPFSGRRKGVAAADWDEFAGKSLEEVLEAALPIAAEAIEATAPPAQQSEPEERGHGAAAKPKTLPHRIAAPIREPIVKRAAQNAMRQETQQSSPAPAGSEHSSKSAACAETGPSGIPPHSSGAEDAVAAAPERADGGSVASGERAVLAAAAVTTTPLQGKAADGREAKADRTGDNAPGSLSETTSPKGNGSAVPDMTGEAEKPAAASVEPAGHLSGNDAVDDEPRRKRSLLDRIRGLNEESVT